MVKKRVAIVISSLSIGGAENMVVQLASNINREIFDIRLFVLCHKLNNQLDEQLAKEAIDVQYIDVSGKVSIPKLIRVSRELNKFRPDILHVHLDTVYSIFWAILHKTEVIFTIHCQPYRLLNIKFQLLFRRLIKRNKILFVGVTDSITREAVNLLGGNISITTVYNPVDILRFQCKKDLTNCSYTFINVARFHPIKNHKLLIESFARLLKRIPAAKLVLVGVGELYMEVIGLVNQYGIEDSVIFMGNVSDVERVLAKADVFVLSSNSEALPITVLEAMASGLPIIATKVGGLPDIIKDNGILVDPNNVEQLSNAMELIINDIDRRIKMSERSLELINKYDLKKITRCYEEIYASYSRAW